MIDEVESIVLDKVDQIVIENKPEYGYSQRKLAEDSGWFVNQ
jgi:hypothetical protein